jgi:drug/metabolite transporter (DMT)-like permease
MNKKWISEIALLFVAFVWGATFVVVQDAIHTMPPFTFNAVRFGLAGIFLLAVFRMKEKNRTAAVMPSVISGIILGFCLFIGYTFQTVGLLYTTASKAGFITGLSVVMVPLLAVIFLKKRPRALSVIGSIAAACGLYLLAVKSTAALSAGDLLVFICAFGFAFHIILTDRFTKHVSVLLVTAVQVLSVSVLSFAGAIFTENWKSALSPYALFRPHLVIALLITAFLATAAAFFIQTIAQRYTPPTHVAIILTMEPVFAALTSFIWVHERLSITAAAGCLLIFTGMLFSELPNLFHLKKHFLAESRSKG